MRGNLKFRSCPESKSTTIYGPPSLLHMPVSCVASCVRLSLRSLPSPGTTPLRRYYEPLRHPVSPGLSLAGVRFGHRCPRHGASRVARAFLVYMLPSLPRRRVWAWTSLIHPVVSAFPGMASGSASASTFSRLARRSLTLRPAHSQQSPIRDHYPKASAISLPP